MSHDLRNLQLCYLASPYSLFVDGLDVAHNLICKIAAALIRAGVHLYCPIAASHELAKIGGLDPLDHKMWMPQNYSFMNVCDTLVIAHLPGWQESYGVGEEIKFFEAAGKPIYDLDPATLLMTRRKSSGMPQLEELRSILTRDKPKSVTPFKAAMARVAELDTEIAGYPLAHNKTPQQGGSSA